MLKSGGAERVMVLLANALIHKVKHVSFLFTMEDVQSYMLESIMKKNLLSTLLAEE